MRRLKRIALAVMGIRWFARLEKYRLACLYMFKNHMAILGARPRTPWVCEFAEFDAARSHAYAREEYQDYLRHAGISEADLQGKAILEIGPGENLAVALRFLLGGASRVVCADRFPSLRPQFEQLEVYRLLDKETGSGRVVGGPIQPNGNGFALRENELKYIPGLAAEALHKSLPARGFDLILSRAVMEHVFDPAAALRSMDAVLKPGGLILHEIDFRDHGMFSSAGLHPLAFLSFPKWIWNRMSSHIGAPNRRFAESYASVLRGLGYRVELFRILDLGSVERICEPFEKKSVLSAQSLRLVQEARPFLAPAFAMLSDGELSLAGLFLRATKP